MGIKENLIKYKEEKMKARRESLAFKKIVEKQNLQARRKAYSEESLKKARLDGKQMVYKKSTGQILSGLLQSAVSKAITPPKKSNPVARRTTVRRPTIKKMSYQESFNPFDQKITY